MGFPFVMLDEDVNASVFNVLGTWGIDYETAQYRRQLSDTGIAALAAARAKLLSRTVLVMTHNTKDFKRLVARRAPEGFTKYRDVGSIYLGGDQARASACLLRVRAWLFAILEVDMKRADKRSFIEVHADRIVSHH